MAALPGDWTRSRAQALRGEAPPNLVRLIDLLAEYPHHKFSAEEIVAFLDWPYEEFLNGILSSLTKATKRLGIAQEEEHSWFIQWESDPKFRYWLSQERADWWTGIDRQFWAFAANPKYYRIEDALAALETDWWNISGHDVSPGDALLIWKTLGSSSRRGVVALAVVEEGPEDRVDSDNPFWQDDPRASEELSRVRIRYHPIDPAWLSEDVTDPLNDLTVSRGPGTVFRVDPATWDRVLEYVEGWPTPSVSKSPDAWSYSEREIAVVSYVQMLKAQLRGDDYVKSAVRRSVLDRLDNRTEKALEFKHQNISAVFEKLQLPRVEGYAPAENYQTSLEGTVASVIADDDELTELLTIIAEEDEPADPLVGELDSIFVDPPPPYVPNEASATSTEPTPVKVDFAARESSNRKLGTRGEEFVVNVERKRLEEAGFSDLADNVEHVSKTRGDGLGYDVRSFSLDKEPIFIEVKTSNGSKTTPFLLSANEIAQSKRIGSGFRLYRVYNFKEEPKIYRLEGPLDKCCHLSPTQFRARVSSG